MKCHVTLSAQWWEENNLLSCLFTYIICDEQSHIFAVWICTLLIFLQFRFSYNLFDKHLTPPFHQVSFIFLFFLKCFVSNLGDKTFNFLGRSLSVFSWKIWCFYLSLNQTIIEYWSEICDLENGTQRFGPQYVICFESLVQIWLIVFSDQYTKGDDCATMTNKKGLFTLLKRVFISEANSEKVIKKISFFCWWEFWCSCFSLLLCITYCRKRREEDGHFGSLR